MKRLPLLASFLLFIALCASIAYWGLQLFEPPLRPVAVPPRVAQDEIRPEAATALFGMRAGGAEVASNYQLKGVIFSGDPRDSVAILSTDGKPAQAIRANTEVVPGVTVKEVHREYVLLSDGGKTKRVELPESAKEQVNFATVSPVPTEPAQGRNIPPRAPAGAVPAPGPAATPLAAPIPPAIPAPPPVAPPAIPAPAPAPTPVQPATTAPPTVVVSPPPSVPAPVVTPPAYPGPPALISR